MNEFTATNRPMPRLTKLSAGSYQTVIDGKTYLILKIGKDWIWRNAYDPDDCSDWKWTRQLTVTNLFHHTNALFEENQK